MIFTVRQQVEKSWEHTAKTFFTFIDLRKAYDSVPCEALWVALEKLGVPDEVAKLIASFHHRMQAKIRLDVTVSEQFEVSNGLRQGCCMAPVLFNLFSCLVIERWRARLEEVEGVGVDLNFKYDKNLFRRYTRNTQVRLFTECLLQMMVYCWLLAGMAWRRAVQEYRNVGSQFGLTVSVQKTKHMLVGRQVDESEWEPIAVEEGEIQSSPELPTKKNAYAGYLIVFCRILGAVAGSTPSVSRLFIHTSPTILLG